LGASWLARIFLFMTSSASSLQTLNL